MNTPTLQLGYQPNRINTSYPQHVYEKNKVRLLLDTYILLSYLGRY